MIKLQRIWKEYQIDKEIVFTALQDVSLEIKKGEFSAIMGPSGSGKSTLMHIIGLLDEPTKGKVYINNKDISRLTDDQLSTLRNEFVGFVFQQFNLIPKLTLLENILIPTIYTRRQLDFVPRERALDLVEKFGLADKANSFPNKISGGQQQRVAIIRSLIMNPQLILADEPTGNLDSKTGHEILDLLSDLNKKEKLTVIVVTHEIDVARRTKKIIKIHDGKIV